MPLPDGFCDTHLRYFLSCSDAMVTAALAALPVHDLARLRKLVIANEPLTEARKMWSGVRVVIGWLETHKAGGTKADIAAGTGLSRTTVRRALAQLDASGTVSKTQTLPSVFTMRRSHTRRNDHDEDQHARPA